MARVNENYLALKSSYLFSEIAGRIRAFQAAHPELLAWKEKVLAREIELEEIDTSAFTDRYGGTMKAITPEAPKVRAAE